MMIISLFDGDNDEEDDIGASIYGSGIKGFKDNIKQASSRKGVDVDLWTHSVMMMMIETSNQ